MTMALASLRRCSSLPGCSLSRAFSSGTSLSPSTSAEKVHVPAVSIFASAIVSRPPLLVPKLTELERHYFHYQRLIHRFLAAPVKKEWYFKTGSTEERDFRIREGALNRQLMPWKYRSLRPRPWKLGKASSSQGQAQQSSSNKTKKTSARNNNTKNVSKGKDTSSSKVEVPEKRGRSRPFNRPNRLNGDQRRALAVRIKARHEKERAALVWTGAKLQMDQDLLESHKRERKTVADKEGNTKSLKRKLDRTLYLTVKTRRDGWILPQQPLASSESLANGALRAVYDQLGKNMDLWSIGKLPASVHRSLRETGEASGKDKPSSIYTFFMPVRVLRGQAALGMYESSQPSDGVEDFAWLTAEELRERLQASYFQALAPIITGV